MSTEELAALVLAYERATLEAAVRGLHSDARSDAAWRQLISAARQHARRNVIGRGTLLETRLHEYTPGTTECRWCPWRLGQPFRNCSHDGGDLEGQG